MVKTLWKIIFFACAISSIGTSQCEDYIGIDVNIAEEEICFMCGFYDFQIVTDDGIANDLYFVDFYASDGTTGFAFWNDGTGFADICFEEVSGCEPQEIDLIFDVFCEDGSLVEQLILPILVFPELSIFIEPPGCGEGENGTVYLENIFTGEVCTEVVTGTAGVNGDCETAQNGTLDYSFLIFEGTLCEQFYFETIEVPCIDAALGCTNPEACNYDPEATCDDGSCEILEVCCPRPVSFPETLCAGFAEVCVEFDGPIEEIEFVDIFSEDGSVFGFEISRDDTQICFAIDAFLEDNCMPLETNLVFFYNCISGEFVEYTVGPITFFPDPANFEPFVNVTSACEEPEVFGGFCGILLFYDIIPSVNDCDNPLPGMVTWTVDPGFNTTNAPECFVTSGSTPIPPCLEDCPCDGSFCNDVCIDIQAELIGEPPSAICAFDFFELEIAFTGVGADIGEYNVDFYVGGILSNSYFHFIGDPTETFVPISIFSSPCTPTDQEITYVIMCPSTGEIISAGSVGTVTVYPDPGQFFPIVLDAFECGQIAQVLAGPCGEVIFDPSLITLECGADAEDQILPWEVDFGFVYDPSLSCNPGPITGEVTQVACSAEPGEPCFSDCQGDGILSADCECIFDNPTSLDYSGPADLSVCAFGQINIELDITSASGSDFEIEVTDNFNIFEPFSYINGDPLPISVNIFLFPEETCFPTTTSLYAYLYCVPEFNLADGPIYLGELTVYPDLSFANIEVIPASECGELPQIISTGCGTIQIDNIIPPVNDPFNPIDGLVEYSLDFGFDAGDSPGCYDPSLFSGTAPITACMPPPPCEADNGTISILNK